MQSAAHFLRRNLHAPQGDPKEEAEAASFAVVAEAIAHVRVRVLALE